MSLVVVTGPPCSGKTTHVLKRRGPQDLVVDLDAIAHTLGYPHPHADWEHDHPAIHAARVARNAVVKAITDGQLDGDAWVIDARPHPISRRIYERAGAQFVDLATPLAECARRAQADRRPVSTLEQIAAWER